MSFHFASLRPPPSGKGNYTCPEGGGLESDRERCNVLSPPGGMRSEAKWKGIFPIPRPGGGGFEHKVERERSLTNILHILGPFDRNFYRACLIIRFAKTHCFKSHVLNACEKMTMVIFSRTSISI